MSQNKANLQHTECIKTHLDVLVSALDSDLDLDLVVRKRSRPADDRSDLDRVALSRLR